LVKGTRKRILQFTVYVSFFILWEIVVKIFGFGGRLLPAPSDIFDSLLANFFAQYNIANSTLITMQEVFLGFILAVSLGILLGMVLAYSQIVRDIITPILMAIQAIPKSAIAPLLVLWFGFGLLSKIMLTFLLSFFPILINSLLGFTSVEPQLLDLLRLMRASTMKIFIKVRVPNSLPYILAALRVAIPLAVIGAVIGEFIAAEAGLGWIILNATYALDVSLTFAALFFLVFLTLIINQIVAYLENRLIPWHITKRGEIRGVA
jgi:NitT/TauT family transport system permease protein